MQSCPSGIFQFMLLILLRATESAAPQTASLIEGNVCGVPAGEARDGDRSMLQKDSSHFSARLSLSEDKDDEDEDDIPDECSKEFPVHCGDGFCMPKNGLPCPTEWYKQLRKRQTPKNDSSPRDVVALTYCDENYAHMWPTFMKCYSQALECSPDVSPEMCGDRKPRLLDLGISKEPGQVGQHCSHSGMPAWIGANSSTVSAANSLLHVSLTPENVPELLMINLAEQLALGRDVLRLDSDAFLLEDVMQSCDRFPEADIISSVDFVQRIDESQWYHEPAYLLRHGLDKSGRNITGSDPLRNWGFMMNTGLTYFRSSTKTSQLASRAALAIKTGKSKFEQIALNEELVDLNCTWSEPERLPLGGNNSENWHSIVTTPMLGACAQGLKVVILPFFSMTRDMAQAELLTNRAVSIHPGPKDQETVEAIATMCEKRQVSRSR